MRRAIAIVAKRASLSLFLAFALCGAAAIALLAATAPEREVLSFEMWCLDMQQYPAARCDTRRGDDVKDYERYRTAVEQFDRQRAEQEKRDRALRDQLNRDPVATKR